MYEYKILKAASLVNEKRLNQIAEEGWRLITVEGHKHVYHFYFERPREFPEHP